MGLAERDYSHRRRGEPFGPSSGLGAARTWSATTWLIAIIVAMFILDALLTPPMTTQLMRMTRKPADEIESGEFLLGFLGPIAQRAHFSISTIRDAQVWRIVTFPFIHTDVWPIFFSVVCLGFFARPLESELGAAGIIALFFACSLAALVTYVVLHATDMSIHAPWYPLAGATAGVLGILVAAACAGPNDDISFWTSGVSAPRRTLAWVACAIVALVAIKQDSTGANAAHLGGAVAGLASVPLVRWWRRY
jgi:membrane associated rhomboid family serine protease